MSMFQTVEAARTGVFLSKTLSTALPKALLGRSEPLSTVNGWLPQPRHHWTAWERALAQPD